MASAIHLAPASSFVPLNSSANNLTALCVFLICVIAISALPQNSRTVIENFATSASSSSIPEPKEKVPLKEEIENDRPKDKGWKGAVIYEAPSDVNKTKEVNASLGDTKDNDGEPPSSRPPNTTSTDLIPLYCALMSLVIVSLIAYVAFKYWRRRYRAASGAKALPGGILGTSGVFPSSGKRKAAAGPIGDDAEDSGVRLMALNTKLCSGYDGRRSELSAQRLRAVEVRLPGETWRELAEALDFCVDDLKRIETQALSLSQPPLRVLLRDFSSRPSATGEQLALALQFCGHHETAALLLAEVIDDTEMARV